MFGISDTTPHEQVLRRIAHVARLVGLGWWALLSGLVVAESEADAWIPWTTLGLAIAWMVIAGALYRVDVFTATWRPVVLVDLLLACVAVGAVALHDSRTLFYGGFPLIVVVVAAIRSPRSAWLAATVLTVVVAVQLGLDRELAFAVSQVLVYPAGAAIASWTMGVLRRAQSSLAEAESARVRAEERSEISRHLHDSVLQTLALVQRNAGHPDEVVSLARRQERELREWLYGGRAESGTRSLEERLRDTAAEVEERYRVAVDVVTVGTAGTDLAATELVSAAREAMVNAAKHADVTDIAVFCEADDQRAVVFVRDRGRGFDPTAVESTRRGIRESIVARLERVGGSASLRSERGTEWRLEVTT